MQKEDKSNLIKNIEKDSSFSLACILLVFLILAACYAFFLNESIRYWDEKHYLLLAKNLWGKLYSFNGKDPTAFQPPGYPFILYGLSLISFNCAFRSIGRKLSRLISIKALMMAIFISMAISEFNRPLSIAIPCSVKAYGR